MAKNRKKAAANGAGNAKSSVGASGTPGATGANAKTSDTGQAGVAGAAGASETSDSANSAGRAGASDNAGSSGGAGGSASAGSSGAAGSSGGAGGSASAGSSASVGSSGGTGTATSAGSSDTGAGSGAGGSFVSRLAARRMGYLDNLLDRSVEHDFDAAAKRRDRLTREIVEGQQSPRIWAWVVRVAFAVVFIGNVQCALLFVINPAAHAPMYQLDGVAGSAAVAGMGVAFLMWNCTYPLFIWQPGRYRVLGWIIMAQQVIGLAGESIIYAGLPPVGYEVLQQGMMAFIAFDGFGLACMLATFLPYLWAARE